MVYICIVGIEVRRSQDVEGVIRRCYATDGDLIEKYHALAPTIEEEAVAHTVKTLTTAINYTLYEIYKDGDFAAYFGTEDIGAMKAVTGMFVMPQHRKPEFLKKYVKIIKSKFAGKIYTYLYEKNSRAVRFIKRNGFKKIDEVVHSQSQERIGYYRFN